jgi:hypothetical protein
MLRRKAAKLQFFIHQADFLIRQWRVTAEIHNVLLKNTLLPPPPPINLTTTTTITTTATAATTTTEAQQSLSG